MVTNLSQSPAFSITKKTSKILGVIDNGPMLLADESMSDLSDITVKNVNIFLTSIETLGGQKLHRSDLLFLLLVNNSYSYDYPLTSNKQERHFPNSLLLRKRYKCSITQQASKSDKLRMHFEKHGFLETFTVDSSLVLTVKFTEKFFLTFQIWTLEAQKNSLLEKNLLSLMDENTIQHIKDLEKQICDKQDQIKKLEASKTKAKVARRI